MHYAMQGQKLNLVVTTERDIARELDVTDALGRHMVNTSHFDQSITETLTPYQNAVDGSTAIKITFSELVRNVSRLVCGEALHNRGANCKL